MGSGQHRIHLEDVMFLFGLHSALTEQHPIGSSNGRIVQQSMQERVLSSPVLLNSSHLPLGSPAGKDRTKQENTSLGLANHTYR